MHLLLARCLVTRNVITRDVITPVYPHARTKPLRRTHARRTADKYPRAREHGGIIYAATSAARFVTVLHARAVCTRARSRKWFTRLICIPGRKRGKKPTSHRLNALSRPCERVRAVCMNRRMLTRADINPLTISAPTKSIDRRDDVSHVCKIWQTRARARARSEARFRFRSFSRAEMRKRDAQEGKERLVKAGLHSKRVYSVNSSLPPRPRPRLAHTRARPSYRR